MRDNPLVLFGSPRGGTSLVAGCFVNHGFWVGTTYGGPNGVGSGGYINYENAAIKKFCKDHWKLDAGKLMRNPEAADLAAFCRKIVPSDTNWMFKGPTEYYPIFAHWFPRMTPVFIFRNEEQAIEAVVRRRGEEEREHAAKIIKARYRIQEEILHTVDYSFAVEADRVMQGDYDQVRDVLNAYHIGFDTEACGRHLQPSRWHV